MVYIVYKTINTLNDRYYIGVHKQKSDGFDGYLGSGIAIREAVRKYGKENFKRETLFSYDNSKQAYAKEKEIVDTELTENSNSYNICGGGLGPAFLSNETRKRMSETRRGKKFSECHKKNLSESLRKTWHDPKMQEKKNKIGNATSSAHKGVAKSKEQREKMSLASKGKKKKRTKCPHCGLEGSVNQLHRWHFDNCRHKTADKISDV